MNQKEVQRVRVVDSFYDGMPPEREAPSYLYHTDMIAIPLPLVLGTTTTLTQFTVQSNQVLEVSGLEAFVSVPAGGAWVDAPADFVRRSLYFQLLRSGAAPWSFTNGIVGAAGQSGFDVLNRNILDMFGDVPGHILFPEGSQLTVDFTVANVALPVPVGTMAGVRITGRLFSQVAWSRVAV